MKRFFPVLVSLTLLIIVLLTLINKNTSYNKPSITSSKPLPVEPTSSITRVDTSKWVTAELHQDISLKIPDGWSAGSDGIYNYNHKEVTGIRDPNFPTNSFKCVFYKDKDLRSKVRIEKEQTLNSMPKVTLINGKWNDQTQDTMRKFDEATSIYTYYDNTDEIYIECNVFKGDLLEDDITILENIILSIQNN